MRSTALFLVVLSAAGAFGSDRDPSPSRPAPKSATLPVTTTSRFARKEFERAMVNLESLRGVDALKGLRAAVKRDPNFAQAYILISHLSHDPDEQVSARKRAEHLAKRLAGMSEPTVDQALVVPQFRSGLAYQQKQAAR